MIKKIFRFCTILFVFSCKIQPGSNRNNAEADKLYKLNLKPVAGSVYSYDISSTSEIAVEVDDKKIVTTNKTNTTINYKLDKDSAGNYLIVLKYKKIHIHAKSAEAESEMDANNAAISGDPTEKMLGALSAATITATVNNFGDVLKMDGYRDITDKVLSDMPNIDVNTKVALQKQWQQMVEQNMVKKNVEQFLRIFPDSAVHIGDKWKLFSKENNGISYEVKNFYTLKNVNDGIATIESDGEIKSDSIKTNYMNYEVQANLNGEQHGLYEMDIKTGMLVSGQVQATIKGGLDMVGRDIPITLKITLSIKGTKAN